MRVAFSGTHRVGKTTLIEAVSAVLPAYEVLDEPYRLLEDDGYEFADPPTAEDFERQLRCSIEITTRAPRDALLDRCPLDFLAYLDAIGAGRELEDWIDDVRGSLETIDLIVYVPIEANDRTALPSLEDQQLRRRVDEVLRGSVLEDQLGFELTAIEVFGTLDARVRLVRNAMNRLRESPT
ncbi:hypothetical protein BH11MYX3_BH11MYX3_16190 [soil metagenome]